MTVVIDGLPIRGTSLGVVLEHLLEGWHQLGTGDRIHLVTGPDSGLRLPDEVTTHVVDLGERYYLNRVKAQSTFIPRLCREVGADAMLAILPTTTFTPLPCPRVEIVHDQRYELRPAQFSRKARFIRSVSYGIGYRQADALICISERTRDDLLASRPYLRARADRVVAVHHGADHVRPPVAPAAQPYAVAFGQHTNKNVGLVLEAWQQLISSGGEPLPLRLFGIPSGERAQLEREVSERGLAGIVTLSGWLEPDDFAEQFAAAALVVFPSDFEGFGLPAVEALQLGIPVVVSPDAALAEVTAGHATTMRGWTAADLVRAIAEARDHTSDKTEAGRAHAARFTWRETAAKYREVLANMTTTTAVSL